MHSSKTFSLKKSSNFNTLKRIRSVTVEDSDGLKRDDSVKRAFKTCVKNFLLETSIHGMKHIVKTDEDKYDTKWRQRLKIFFGRYFWVLITFVEAAFCLYMMSLVYTRYISTPTVTTVETINNPISEVPFPAVTVCNINKVHYPNTERIRKLLKENNIEEDHIQTYLGNMSKTITMDFIDETSVRVEYVLERLGFIQQDIMREVILDCSEMITNCSWLGQPMKCNELFRMVKSSKGFCCSFNYFGLRDEFNINYDNHNMSLVNTSNVYVSGAGEFVGLIFNVDTKIQSYTSPIENYFGAEIIIHSSYDYPDQDINSAVVQPGDDLRLAIRPEIINSSPDIRDLDVVQRQCLFYDEKKLILSRNYSFDACMTECRAEHVMELCHCMSFMFPKYRPLNEAGYVRQCGLKDLFCLRAKRHILFSLEQADKPKDDNITGMHCNCLPSCSTILYKLEPNVGEMIKDEQNPDTSIVYVFFEDLTCLKYRRDPFMSWDALFAAFGGIFGLCLGGSIISLIEIGYFMTFKFYTMIQKYQHEFRINYLKKIVEEKTKNDDAPVFAVKKRDSMTKFAWID